MACVVCCRLIDKDKAEARGRARAKDILGRKNRRFRNNWFVKNETVKVELS